MANDLASPQLFAWNNYTLTAALAAGSIAGSLSPENLRDLTGSPAMAWQTAAGVLTASSGARLTIRPTLLGQTWRAVGLFRTNLTPSAAVTFSLKSDNSTLWAMGVMGPLPGYGQVVAIAPGDVAADYCQIDIDDPGNTDGFINVPLVFAGPAWQMLTAADYASAFGMDHAADEAVSRGGQEYGNMRWERRRWELVLQGIRTAEQRGPVTELNRVARTGVNVLFCPDITDPYALAAESVYGRLTPTADIGYPYGGADRRSWKVRIQERL